jgi:hypothetical protein
MGRDKMADDAVSIALSSLVLGSFVSISGHVLLVDIALGSFKTHTPVQEKCTHVIHSICCALIKLHYMMSNYLRLVGVKQTCVQDTMCDTSAFRCG